jgi:hypothetical protein
MDSTSRGKRVFAKVKKGGKVTPHVFWPTSSTECYTRKSMLLHLEVDEPSFADRFGFKEPVSALYEVTPWSFVFDWVLPIGDWISAQQFAWNTKGTVEIVTKTYLVTTGNRYLGPDQPGYDQDEPPAWVCSNITFDRVVSGSIPVPLPVMKSDLLGGEPLNRLANAFSLLVGLGSGRNNGTRF